MGDLFIAIARLAMALLLVGLAVFISVPVIWMMMRAVWSFWS